MTNTTNASYGRHHLPDAISPSACRTVITGQQVLVKWDRGADFWPVAGTEHGPVRHRHDEAMEARRPRVIVFRTVDTDRPKLVRFPTLEATA